NGFVVTKDTASKYNLKKLSDISGGSAQGQLILGGPPECPSAQRPFCKPGLEQTYGIKFKDFKPLDAGGPLTVAALDGKQIDIGLLFTSDPTIVAKSFVLLEDDKPCSSPTTSRRSCATTSSRRTTARSSGS